MWLNPGETRNEQPAQQTSAGFAAAANARGARGPRRSCAEHTLSPSPFPGPAAPQRDTEGPTRPEREAAGARRLPGAAAVGSFRGAVVTAASRGSPAPGAQRWSAEHACMHTNRQTHTHVHTYTQTYTCMHTRAHTQTHMCTHTSPANTHMHAPPATHSANHSATHSATHSDTRLSLCTRKAAASEGHANDS